MATDFGCGSPVTGMRNDSETAKQSSTQHRSGGGGLCAMRRTLIRSQAETSDDEAIAAHQQWSRRPRERWELLREACEQATLGSRLSALGSLPENELAVGQTRAQRSNLEWHIREAQCERRQRRRRARIAQMPVTDPEPFVFRTLVELVNDFTQQQRARALIKEAWARALTKGKLGLAPLQNDAPALGDPQEVSRKQRKAEEWFARCHRPGPGLPTARSSSWLATMAPPMAPHAPPAASIRGRGRGLGSTIPHWLASKPYNENFPLPPHIPKKRGT
jgi:hypothetical protein